MVVKFISDDKISGYGFKAIYYAFEDSGRTSNQVSDYNIQLSAKYHDYFYSK